MALGDVEAKEVEEKKKAKVGGRVTWAASNVETLLLDQTGFFRRPVAIRITANT